MKQLPTDTIAAIITPIGVGGVGTIRISGTNSLNILKRLIPNTSSIETHKIFLSKISEYNSKKTIDQALVVYMAGPKTYTGEDVVEISCHGNQLILQRALETIIYNGARIAEAGEFTRRAFINGKIDLTQAEAILDLVMANSGKGQELAYSNLEGRLSARLGKIKNSIMNILAEIEIGADFPDDLSENKKDELVKKIGKVAEEMGRLVKEGEQGRIVKEGFRVAIVGKPNVGKSSILNAIIGESRAIVTHIPGTTRDTIEEELQYQGMGFLLIDTAGLRAPNDEVEAHGVERAKRETERAGIVLLVLDGSEPLTEEDNQIMRSLNGCRKVIALNKKDLGEKVKALAEWGGPSITISAKKGEGIEELKEVLLETAIGSAAIDSIGITINKRQRQQAIKAEAAIRAAKMALNNKQDEAIIAMELKEAAKAIAETTGEEVTDEVIDHIFASFCVGK